MLFERVGLLVGLGALFVGGGLERPGFGLFSFLGALGGDVLSFAELLGRALAERVRAVDHAGRVIGVLAGILARPVAGGERDLLAMLGLEEAGELGRRRRDVRRDSAN